MSMKDYYDEQLDAFLAELKEESIKALKKENITYSELCTAHSNIQRNIEEALENSSNEILDFVESMKENMNEMGAIETDWIYLQGYKDCIRFLKVIKALT